MPTLKKPADMYSIPKTLTMTLKMTKLYPSVLIIQLKPFQGLDAVRLDMLDVCMYVYMYNCCSVYLYHCHLYVPKVLLVFINLLNENLFFSIFYLLSRYIV